MRETLRFVIFILIVSIGCGLFGIKSMVSPGGSTKARFLKQTEPILNDLKTSIINKQFGLKTDKNNYIIDKIEEIIEIRREGFPDVV